MIARLKIPARFYAETRLEPARGGFVSEIWSVRIAMFRPDRTGYDIELRKRYVRSRTLEQELDRVQKKLKQYLDEEPESVGSGKIKDHLEKYIESLKARIAEQKAK